MGYNHTNYHFVDSDRKRYIVAWEDIEIKFKEEVQRGNDHLSGIHTNDCLVFYAKCGELNTFPFRLESVRVLENRGSKTNPRLVKYRKDA